MGSNRKYGNYFITLVQANILNIDNVLMFTIVH